MKEKEINQGDSGRWLETIKIKKYEEKVPPGGKRAYEEIKEAEKLSKTGKLAKETLIINRKKRGKYIRYGSKTKKENGN